MLEQEQKQVENYAKGFLKLKELYDFIYSNHRSDLQEYPELVNLQEEIEKGFDPTKDADSYCIWSLDAALKAKHEPYAL